MEESFEKFEKHQNTLSHHEAVDYIATILSTCKDVGEMLSSGLAKQKAENRKMLQIIFSTIQFLERPVQRPVQRLVQSWRF